MTTIVKSYKLKSFANESKVKALLDLHNEYILAARVFRREFKIRIQKGLRFSNTDQFYKNVPGKLSQRYKQVCMRQVAGMMKSWNSNYQNDLKKKINKCSDPQLRKKLHIINRENLTAGISLIPEKLEIKKSDILIFKALRRSLMKCRRFPRVDGINIQLSELVSDIQASKKPRTENRFDFWINVSTLDKGNKVLVPVRSNDYFDNVIGKVSASCNMIVNREKRSVSFSILKEIETNYKPSDNVIALDFGLNTLFSDQFGNQYGQKFKEKLYYYDSKISALQKNLQRQKIRPKSSKRFNALVSKARSYIKNEVNRVINHIVRTHEPKEIVIEDLDFRGSNMGKRLNRIISKCGRSEVKKKLLYLESIGIKITYMNPAYSSQECSRCHKVEKSHRDGKNYNCKVCGLNIDADVNAPRVLYLRRSQGLTFERVGRDEIRQILGKRFDSLASSLPDLVRQYGLNSWSSSSMARLKTGLKLK